MFHFADTDKEGLRSKASPPRKGVLNEACLDSTFLPRVQEIKVYRLSRQSIRALLPRAPQGERVVFLAPQGLFTGAGKIDA